MIIATHGILASISTFIPDTDAQAFFDRVTTAGGSLSNTEKTAINQLVLDMKSYSIWTKMQAIYPMVGASSAACAQNLKSSSFTGTFTSGWTFASTGVTPNGTSAYMNTGFNINTLSSNNGHLSYYSRSNIAGFLVRDIGSNDTSGNLGNPEFTLNMGQTANNSMGGSFGDYNKNIFYSISNYQGFGLISRVSSTSLKLYKNNSVVGNNTNNNTLTTLSGNFPIYIGAVNAANTADRFSNRQCAFSSIGDGLTDTEASNFYTAVQTFNTTLSRQV